MTATIDYLNFDATKYLQDAFQQGTFTVDDIPDILKLDIEDKAKMYLESLLPPSPVAEDIEDLDYEVLAEQKEQKLPDELAKKYSPLEGPELSVGTLSKFAVDTTENHDLTDVMTAVYRTENILGSFFAKEAGMPDVKTTDFDPWEYMSTDEKIDDSFTQYAKHADSVEEIEAVRRQVARERQDRQTISEAGTTGVLTMIGQGVFDPIMLLTSGATIPANTYRAGNGILKSGLITAGVVTGETTAQELALHATQTQRTYGESAVNISASAFLSGVLGSGIQAITNKTDFFPYIKNLGYKKFDKPDKIIDDLEQTMNVEPKMQDGINPTVNEKTPNVSESTAGAQAVFGDVEVSGKLAKKITELTAFTGPLTRTLTSDEQITRQIVVRLADNPIKVDGFSGQSVEQLAKTYSGNLAVSVQNNNKLFDAYKNNGGKLKQREFNEAVAKAIRSGESDIPEVKQSADYWMENLYNPLKERMIEEKLLPEDVDVSTSVNYLNRIYDKGKIDSNYDEFIKRVSTWLRNEDLKMHEKSKSKKPFEEQDYDDLAEQIANRILGTSDGVLPYDWQLGMSTKNTYLQPLAKLRGPMQKRVFNINDELIEDFLINDIEVLGARYYRQTAADVELMREFGDISMQTQINDISKAYTRKMETLTKKATEAEAKGDAKTGRKLRKQSADLNKKRIRDIADIEGMRDRIRGVYNIGEDTVFSRIGRTTRDLNYLRFMGGVTISSFPDVARVIMSEGFIKTFGNGLMPLIKNAKNFKIAADELKGYGIGTDALITGRAEIIADIADYTQGGTMFERGARSLAGGFGKINVLDYWTAGLKQLQAVTMQTRIFDDLKKGKYDKRLERLGISKSDADAMWKQVQQHGKKIDGVWITNSANWDNPTLARMYGAAMRKESDRVIIIPGQEKPLFMSREMGGLFFQFRSFIMSATQRVLIAGLQNQDHNAIGGLLSLIGMGTLVYTVKTLERGEELSDDPRVWLMEGIDRSGAIGILTELNVTLEKLSQNQIGLRPLLGIDAPSSKYVAHSLSQTALGPTFGSLLNDTIRALSTGVGPDEMTEADIRTLRRLLPYQNLTGVRQALDKVEEAIGDSL